MARHINIRIGLVFAAALLLSPLGAMADPGKQARLAAECEMYVAARAMTEAATGEARVWILSGCPGYKTAVNPREGSGITTMVALSGTPKAARKYGKWGKLLYQRMLFRGVPARVAAQMADQPEFARAVAAYQQTSGEN